MLWYPQTKMLELKEAVPFRSTQQEAAQEDSTFLEKMTSTGKKKNRRRLNLGNKLEVSPWAKDMNMEEGDPKSPSSPSVKNLEWTEVQRNRDRRTEKQNRAKGPGGESSFGQPRPAEVRAGDWRYPKPACKDWMNYIWRTACMKCRAPKLGMGREHDRQGKDWK